MVTHARNLVPPPQPGRSGGSIREVGTGGYGKNAAFFASPGRAGTVESIAGWRNQQRGERDAGLVAPGPSVPAFLYRCSCCSCCIGPDYYEEYMFLYPVIRREIRIAKGTIYCDYEVLRVCGSCAHRRFPLLSSWLLVLRPEYWNTTYLLCHSDEKPARADLSNPQQLAAIRHAISDHVLCYHYLLFYFLLISFNISLGWLFSLIKRGKEKVVQIPRTSSIRTSLSQLEEYCEDTVPPQVWQSRQDLHAYLVSIQ